MELGKRHGNVLMLENCASSRTSVAKRESGSFMLLKRVFTRTLLVKVGCYCCCISDCMENSGTSC